MNKLLPLSIFLFFANLSFAQEVNKSKVDDDQATIEYIKAEKQHLKESTEFSSEKFKNIHAGNQTANTSINPPDANAIQAKIEYLQDLNCCEEKIEELEAQLAEINN